MCKCDLCKYSQIKYGQIVCPYPRCILTNNEYEAIIQTIRKAKE